MGLWRRPSPRVCCAAVVRLVLTLTEVKHARVLLGHKGSLRRVMRACVGISRLACDAA